VLALRRRKVRSLAQILTITVVSGVVMSAVIEVFEFPEEIADEILDLGCGALGGFIAGLIAWWWRRRQER
jgi:hypothetical protein